MNPPSFVLRLGCERLVILDAIITVLLRRLDLFASVGRVAAMLFASAGRVAVQPLLSFRHYSTKSSTRQWYSFLPAFGLYLCLWLRICLGDMAMVHWLWLRLVMGSATTGLRTSLRGNGLFLVYHLYVGLYYQLGICSGLIRCICCHSPWQPPWLDRLN